MLNHFNLRNLLKLSIIYSLIGVCLYLFTNGKPFTYFNEFGGSTQGRIATAQDDNKIFYGTNSIFAISKNFETDSPFSGAASIARILFSSL